MLDNLDADGGPLHSVPKAAPQVHTPAWQSSLPSQGSPVHASGAHMSGAMSGHVMLPEKPEMAGGAIVEPAGHGSQYVEPSGLVRPTSSAPPTQRVAWHDCCTVPLWA